MDKRISKEMITAVTEIKDVNEFMDNAVSIVNFKDENVQEILEEDESTIRTIAEIAQKYAPEYDTAKILKELWKNK